MRLVLVRTGKQGWTLFFMIAFHGVIRKKINHTIGPPISDQTHYRLGPKRPGPNGRRFIPWAIPIPDSFLNKKSPWGVEQVKSMGQLLLLILGCRGFPSPGKGRSPDISFVLPSGLFLLRLRSGCRFRLPSLFQQQGMNLSGQSLLFSAFADWPALAMEVGTTPWL